MVEDVPYRINKRAKQRLRSALQGEAEVLSLVSEPELAGLCSCLALQFEMGHPTYDRLSPFFGLEPRSSFTNPWKSEVFLRQGRWGLRLWPIDGKPLTLRHRSLANLLNPSSFCDDQLRQVVLVPADIAQRYREFGFELVVVRDWLLATSLCDEKIEEVPYLSANMWEVESNISRTQCRLMRSRQLPFFGTHDVVDHLFDADRVGYDLSHARLNALDQVFEELFGEQNLGSIPPRMLLISYIIGVALDDLAQPRWYGSERHIGIIDAGMACLMEEARRSSASAVLTLPDEFSHLIASLRDKNLPIQCWRSEIQDVVRALPQH